MPKKLKLKTAIKWGVLGLLMSFGLALNAGESTSAAGCPEVEVIFVRGSGGTRWVDDNYNAFKNALEGKLKLTDIDYEFLDLDYPAVGVGLLSFDQVRVTLGAAVGSGDAYEFGESVDAGVSELVRVVNTTCPETKFVAGGYSQGAMVVSKALPQLNAEKVIYMATFGDPKIYLPEGKGVYPDACKGVNLSDYRIYVPDCRAYEGKLGSYRPYEPDELSGKVGTWCNKHDIFCTPYLSLTSHVSYIKDNLYEEASKTIFDKIVTEFGVGNPYTAKHETAILIDSTYSMQGLINRYKKEALALAEKTLASGGKVALFDYRDLRTGYTPVEWCNFETCTFEVFKEKLNEILTDTRRNGDDPESLLSALKTVMNSLNWRTGATKSIVAVTDATYLDEDRDGTTLAEVVDLSKKIDPVNIYVVTLDGRLIEDYEELTSATGGKIASKASDLATLTQYIMARYDSLPRVEEMSEAEVLAEISERPEIFATNFEQVGADAVLMEWKTDGAMTMVFLNDGLVGVTDSQSLMLTGLDIERENIVTLVPMSETVSGERVEVRLKLKVSDDSVSTIPKAPNTGRQ